MGKNWAAFLQRKKNLEKQEGKHKISWATIVQRKVYVWTLAKLSEVKNRYVSRSFQEHARYTYIQASIHTCNHILSWSNGLNTFSKFSAYSKWKNTQISKLIHEKKVIIKITCKRGFMTGFRYFLYDNHDRITF